MPQESKSIPEKTQPMPAFSNVIIWKELATWHRALTTWLDAYVTRGAIARLEALGSQNLYSDDSDWVDVILGRELECDLDFLIEDLAAQLEAATVRVYHGCRVADAGVFTREGIKINSPEVLANEARRIVAEEEKLAWVRPKIEQLIADFDDKDRDNGKLYVCIDDRAQLDDSGMGHYALYGSEWMLFC